MEQDTHMHTANSLLFHSVLVLIPLSYTPLFSFALDSVVVLDSRCFSLVIISTFSPSLIIPHFFNPPPPSTDIVMLLHTTLSRLKRWSHEWSLQFKSTQPSRRLKWIFCIYSCNNDSIWGYYLQTVAEFSAALITERRGQYRQDEKCIYSDMFRMNWRD